MLEMYYHIMQITILKESLLQHANEKSNVYDLARALGYNAKNAVPVICRFRCFSVGSIYRQWYGCQPDFAYALNIRPGMRIKQKSGPASFRTLD
jgi:hypothetical protein